MSRFQLKTRRKTDAKPLTIVCVGRCVVDPDIRSVLLAAFCFFLVGIASAQGYITALSSSIHNFPASARGKVVGAIASMFGVSATVISLLYTNAFRGGDDSLAKFFFLCACLMGGSNLVGFVFLRKIPAFEVNGIEAYVDPEIELQPFEELSMEEEEASVSTETPKATRC